MGKISDKRLTELKRLLEADEEPEEPKDTGEGEEFVVFKGSVEKFKEVFGFAPPPSDDSDHEDDDKKTTESDEDKKDPKPKGKGYFG